MLRSLAIRDIVLIEALDLDFGSGLTVLTGETGAGKSILLDALGLALGERADSGLVRSGCERALVTASFDPPMPGGELAQIIANNDLDCEPGEALVIRRSLRADGGSRAFVNDQPVSAGLLRQLGRYLIEIHGQHDDRGLINPRGHRDLLDAFARADGARVAAAWRGWQAARAALESALAGQEEAERDREFLEHAVKELDAFAPVAGEEEELASARAAMMQGEKLTGDLADIRALFDGSDGGLANLRSAARKLDRIAAGHALLAEALAALDRAIIDAGEAEDRLARAAEAMEFDPVRLDAIETRLFDLRGFARKYRCDSDALPETLAQFRARLEALTDGGQSLGALQAAADRARGDYIAAAQELREIRLAGAKALDSAVASELAPLKLDAARFVSAVESLPEAQWGGHGIDRVEFLIATNPGAPLAPLIKIASGGELSRFILALKVALAEEGGARTIIFDEIDRGVGGAVASAIGDRLARLANQRRGEGTQLLVVTHSPQVASKGNAHLLIAKSSEGTVTRTSVAALDPAGRQEEVARMLSGTDITDEARAQADRLLEGV
jgi:DNA repair protein RecN (Recombination protein N)